MSQTEVSLQSIIEAVKKWTQFIQHEHKTHRKKHNKKESTQHAAILQFFDHCVESFPELIFKDVESTSLTKNQPDINNLAILWFLRQFLEIRKYFPLDPIKVNDFIPSIYGIFKKYFVIFRKKHFTALQQWLLLLYSILEDLIHTFDLNASALQYQLTSDLDLKISNCYDLTINTSTSTHLSNYQSNPITNDNITNHQSRDIKNQNSNKEEISYSITVESLQDQLALIEVIVVQMVSAFEVEPHYIEQFSFVDDNFKNFTHLLNKCFNLGTFITKLHIMKFISLYLHHYEETSIYFVELSLNLCVGFIDSLFYRLPPLKVIDDENDVVLYNELILREMCTYFSRILDRLAQIILNHPSHMLQTLQTSFDENVIGGIDKLFQLFNSNNDSFNRKIDTVIRAILNVSSSIIRAHSFENNHVTNYDTNYVARHFSNYDTNYVAKHYSNNDINYVANHDNCPSFITMATALSIDLIILNPSKLEEQPTTTLDIDIENLQVTNLLHIAQLCNLIYDCKIRNQNINENLNKLNDPNLISKYITKLSEYLIVNSNNYRLSLQHQMLIVYWLNVIVLHQLPIQNLNDSNQMSNSLNQSNLNMNMNLNINLNMIKTLLGHALKFNCAYLINCVIQNILHLPCKIDISILMDILKLLLECLFTHADILIENSPSHEYVYVNVNVLLIFKFLAVVSHLHTDDDFVNGEFIYEILTSRMLQLEPILFVRFFHFYSRIVCFYARLSNSFNPTSYTSTIYTFYDIINKVDGLTFVTDDCSNLKISNYNASDYKINNLNRGCYDFNYGCHDFNCGCYSNRRIFNNEPLMRSFFNLIDYLHDFLTSISNEDMLNLNVKLKVQVCYVSCVTILSGHFAAETMAAAVERLFDYLSSLDWSSTTSQFNHTPTDSCDLKNEPLDYSVISWLLSNANEDNYNDKAFNRIGGLIDVICGGKLQNKSNPMECVHFLHLLIVAHSIKNTKFNAMLPHHQINNQNNHQINNQINHHNNHYRNEQLNNYENNHENNHEQLNDNGNEINASLLEEQILMWLVKIAVIHHLDKTYLCSIAHTIQSMINNHDNDYTTTFDIYTRYSLKINVMVLKFVIENRLLVVSDYEINSDYHSSTNNNNNPSNLNSNNNMNNKNMSNKNMSMNNDLVKKIIYILDRLFNPYNKHSLYSIFINESISLLIHMGGEEAYQLLGVIADYCSCNVNEMLCKSAKHIYSYLFLHCNGEELERCSAFIQRCTKNNYELDSLARQDMHNVIIHLIGHLCVDQTTVMMAIAIILSIEPNHDNSSTAIKDYLSLRLYGLIAYFNNLLSHGNYMELRLSIKSLAYLVELLGECHTRKVLHKLLALIKSTTMKYKQVHELALHTCQLWKSFVQILSVETCVGILPHISSGLIQLHAFNPNEVYEIYQMIVFDKFSNSPTHCFSLIALPVFNNSLVAITTNNSLNNFDNSNLVNNVAQKFDHRFDGMIEQILTTWKQQLQLQLNQSSNFEYLLKVWVAILYSYSYE